MQPIIFKNLDFKLAFYNSYEVTILFCNVFSRVAMKLPRNFQSRTPEIVPEFVTNIVEVFNGFSMANSFHGFRTEECHTYS